MKKEKWVFVHFEYDVIKTLTVRHKRTGKVLRSKKVNSGIVNTCFTSIPESESHRAVEYIASLRDFEGTNPRNLIIK